MRRHSVVFRVPSQSLIQNLHKAFALISHPFSKIACNEMRIVEQFTVEISIKVCEDSHWN